MIYEIYGSPDSGKSSYALSLLEKDKIILYINSDFQATKELLSENMYILNSNNITLIKESVTHLIDLIDVVIIDSLPTVTNEENNTEKVISDIQKIISVCNRNRTDLYVINQLRYRKDRIDYTYYLNRLKLYYHKRIKVGQ
jgi:predicted ATP-dependent serine protease